MEEITIIDRKLVTQATQLDIMMDECTDEDTYKSLKKKYRQLLYPYCLWDATFVEDREQSEWDEDEDLAKHIYEENGKFGVKKTNLYVGFPAVYDKIEVTGVYFGATLVYKDGKMGLIEVQPGETNMVFDTVYDDIKIIRYKQFVLKKDDKYIYWHNGKASEPFDNIHVPRFAGWITVCQEGTWGWLDGDLRFTTNLLDAHEYTLDDGIDKFRLGEFHDVSREELNRCSELDNELAACQEADRSEAEKAAEQYSAFISDNQEKTVFCENGKYGIKDFLDYAMVPPEYDEIILKNQFTAYGRKQNLWGLILDDGNSITNPRIEFDKPPMTRVFGNWLEVQVKGKWGLYETYKDEYLLEPVYDDLHVQKGYFHIILKKDNKYGFYDSRFFVPCDYDAIWWGRGLSFVKFKKDGKWGYMDADTHWVEDIGKARVIAVNPMWDEQNI